MLETFTAQTFEPLLGSPFTVVLGGDELPTLDLALVAVVEVGGNERGWSGRKRQPFSLTFRGPASWVLTQRIYPLRHEELGEFELFLVPIGPDQTGMQYEAIFT